MARCTVERIMRANGWRGVTRARRIPRTTEPDPAAARAPDLVGRQWRVSAPNLLVVADFTYVPMTLRVRLHRVCGRCLRRADPRLGVLAPHRLRRTRAALRSGVPPSAKVIRSTMQSITVTPEVSTLQSITARH